MRVLRRGDLHVLRRALAFMGEGKEEGCAKEDNEVGGGCWNVSRLASAWKMLSADLSGLTVLISLPPGCSEFSHPRLFLGILSDLALWSLSLYILPETSFVLATNSSTQRDDAHAKHMRLLVLEI